MESNKLDKEKNRRKYPRWFIVAILLSVLPVLGWPIFMANYDFSLDPTRQNLMLLYAFPIYVVVTAYLSYRSYPLRKEIAYTLLLILWLSYIAVLFL